MTEDKIRALVESQHQAFIRSAEERRDNKLEAFLAIAKCLGEGRMTTADLTIATKVRYQLIYYYLSTLHNNGIVVKESNGRQVLWMLKE